MSGPGSGIGWVDPPITVMTGASKMHTARNSRRVTWFVFLIELTAVSSRGFKFEMRGG
jgi:hypothetical protein